MFLVLVIICAIVGAFLSRFRWTALLMASPLVALTAAICASAAGANTGSAAIAAAIAIAVTQASYVGLVYAGLGRRAARGANNDFAEAAPTEPTTVAPRAQKAYSADYARTPENVG